MRFTFPPPLRATPTFLATPAFLSTPAAAHTGHIAEVGSHDHWGLAIGLGVIAGAAALAWVKGRRGQEVEPEAAEPDAEAETEGEPA